MISLLSNSSFFFRILGWLLLLLLIVSCASDHRKIALINILDKPRPDARVTILRDTLSAHGLDLASQAFVIRDSNQQTVPFQMDDLDGDGEWDELALVYSLSASDTTVLQLHTSPGDSAAASKDRAQIWFAKEDSNGNYQELKTEIRPQNHAPSYYQFEGPGWENDNIGFRMYFDERNGFDIWGKTTTELVLQDVGTGDNYHALSDWGMDILYVGNSVGAGAIAAKSGNELVRLQDTNEEQFVEITDGPVRAIFDLIYTGFKLNGISYNLRERITIWAGSHGFSNDVYLASGDSLTVISGMVTSKLNNDPTFSTQSDSFCCYVASYGPQSANGADLGMAILTSSDDFSGYGKVDHTGGSVDSTAYLEFKLTQEDPIRYLFLAGWATGSKQFNESEAFKKELHNTIKREQNPVQIIFP